MAKTSLSCTWLACTLLVALAACGENITQSPDRSISTPSPGDPLPTSSGVAAVPPTLELTSVDGWVDLHTPPGFAPPTGKGYSLILKGENFTPDWAGTAYIHAILLDGTPLLAAYGSGRGADGSYRMIYSGNCPSRFREAWAVIMASGRSFESKHIVPLC